MKSAVLKRFFFDEKETLGTLTTQRPGSKNLWICKTLELGWHDNQKNISCIPMGKYLCKWTKSPAMSLKHGYPFRTYEVQDVPDREGIRIHTANLFSELLGCIALGDAHKDINLDRELDVVHSGRTVLEFENVIMLHEDFVLHIEM